MNEDRPREPLWYHEPWPVALAVLFLPPLGLPLLWASRRLSRTVKVAVAAFVGVTVRFVLLLDGQTGWVGEGLTRLASWEAFYRARGLAEGRRHREALPHALRAVQLNPASRRMASLLGKLHEDCGEDRAAELAYRAACKDGGFSIVDLLPRLEKDNRRLRDEIRQALLGSEGDASLRLVGFLLRKNRPVAEIDGILDHLASKRLCDPSGERFCLARARLALRQGRMRTARRFARQVIDGQEYGGPTAKAYGLLAEASLKETDIEAALAYYCFALRHGSGSKELRAAFLDVVARSKKDPVPWRVWAGTMRLCRHMGGTKEARALLRKIWETQKGFPFRPLAAFQLGQWLYNDEKNWDEAAKAFEDAASIEGELKAKALYFLARSHQEAKRDAPARKAFNACLEHAPPASRLARWSRWRLKELEDS